MSTTILSPAIAHIASRQHTVVTREDLQRARIDHNDIDRAVRRRQLVTLHRGIYAVAGNGIDWVGRAYADYRYLQRSITRKHDGTPPVPVVAITGLAELALRGLAVTPPKTALLVTDPMSRSRAVLHRHREGLAARELPMLEGMRATGLPHALAEATSVLPPTSFANVVAELLRTQQASVARLREAAVELPDHLQINLLGHLETLTEADLRARSGKERIVHRAAVRAGLPIAQVNSLVDLNGTLHELDLWWPAHQVGLEIDGPHHDEPAQRAKDEARDEDARAVGAYIERCTTAEVDTALDEVIEHLSHLLTHAFPPQ